MDVVALPTLGHDDALLVSGLGSPRVEKTVTTASWRQVTTAFEEGADFP